MTIKELAELIQSTVGHQGEIVWDSTKPDGTTRKLMDNAKIRNFGWSPKIILHKGIEITYEHYKKNITQ